jgi:hypothetical protein
MLNASEKAYCLAMQSLREKKYRQALDLFDQAASFFEANAEFNLLRETTRVLLAVKSELIRLGADDSVVVEEILSDLEFEQI